MKEKPQEIEPGTVPTTRLLRSLNMQATRRGDGKWSIRAPWLVDAVVADTWEDAYWLAVKARPA